MGGGEKETHGGGVVWGRVGYISPRGRADNQKTTPKHTPDTKKNQTHHTTSGGEGLTDLKIKNPEKKA